MRIALHIFLTLFCLCVLWDTYTRVSLENTAQGIVSPGATPTQKVKALLNWMIAERIKEPVSDSWEHFLKREPLINLAHRDTLADCGTSVNGFINLASTMDIPVRRLLLLDSHFVVYHVVSEVELSGRWTVVDPSKGIFLGKTRSEIQGYTEHVRVARIPIIGPSLQEFLIRRYPDWSDSTYLSLILERDSTLFLLGSGFLTAFAAWKCFQKSQPARRECYCSQPGLSFWR